MASFAPTADLRSGRGRTASFAPTAGTQCLSRLRRAHSAFRAYGGHTVPSSRLRRAHSAFSAPTAGTTVPFRAYGGHTVPFAPTAGTQCLSPPYGVPYKRKLQGICLPTPYGEGSTEASQSLYKKRERKKSNVPTRHPENSSEKHRRTQP